jgi:chromosome segregation ATPase
MSKRQVASECQLTVNNIGGIDKTEISFEPGITVLAGRNATNRTSLLQAIMAALGSDDVTMKADADEARVELTLDGETYTRTLQRQNGTVQASGAPYLDDSTLADLFAFLLESNAARRAVVTDSDLRELIMQPVDTDEIQTEIEHLVEERRHVEEELDELDSLKGRLPSLEKERTRLEDQIEETKTDLGDLEAEIDGRDADIEQSREEQAELETKLETLREKRSTVEDIRYELETEAEALDSLRQEEREVEEAHEELPETPAGDLEEIETRIDRLREQKQALESELNDLQRIIGFNQELLEGSENDFFEVIEEDADSEAVTDELLPDDSVRCWTCGSEVAPDQVETTIEKLRELSQDTVGEINDIEAELDDLKATRRERQDQQRRRKRLKRRERELDDEIAEAEAQVESLSERRDVLREEIDRVEGEVEALENDAYEELLDLHKKANQLEYDLGTHESDLESVEEEIARIEARLDEEETLEERHDELTDEIAELRTKIERIEQQAVEAFNEHMDTVLEMLEYDNLARVWLERTETEVREGRRTISKGVFELHIIRQTDSGTTYEDTVAHLSESEREVTGLVFALAGYLAHDVHEKVPFILLDSVEAIDSDRIADLVAHLSEHAEYLIIALLPEDAGALSTVDTRITEI